MRNIDKPSRTIMSISTDSSRISTNAARSLKGLRNLSEGNFQTGANAPEWDLKKIYGRENESKIIQDHIDKHSTGTIIVKGFSGSGKSSLVESQNFKEDGWIFAKGKYELHRKQEPYSALIDALDSLVDQWIINNENASVCRMKSLNNLLDKDLNFLENILPKAFEEVEAWKTRAEQCGWTKKSSESNSKTKCEAQYQSEAVNAAFWRILSFFCEVKPVVLFLDDIQWADQASLDAIQVLSSAGNIKGFLLILSYRSEEVKEGSVLNCLNFIEEESERLETIHVINLDVENTNKIVSSLLEQQSERTLELSKVIHSKTAGNPFFLVQFIQMLRHECFLKYDMINLEWEWGDVDKMDQLASVSDNVADVIASCISKLSATCLTILQIASCLGKVIPLQVLIEYIEKYWEGNSECDAVKRIRLQGLIQVFDEAVKLGILTRFDHDKTFVWAHDKLQQVVYSTTSGRCVQTIHKYLGMLLWDKHRSNPENGWMLYMAADQFNHLTDVTDDSLNEDIARLSCQASHLSTSKAAFFPALDMIRFSAKHLGNMKEAWKTSYELSLDVYSTLAELSIRFASCEEALNAARLVERHAITLEDKIRAQIVFHRHKVEGGDRDYAGAIEIVKNILLDYGVKLPTKMIPWQLFLERRKLKAHLGGRVEAFLTIPKLDEENIDHKRLQIIIYLISIIIEYAVYLKKEDLSFYAATRILNISIKEGTSIDTALAIAHFGGLLVREGHQEVAMKWGEVAIKLADSFPHKLGSHHTLVHSWVNFGLFSISLPFHNILDPILELNRISLRHGDIQQGAMAWIGYFYLYVNVGLPLDPLNSDLMSFFNEARQFGVPATIKVLFPIFRQTINNLKVLQLDPTLLKGEIFDQEKDLKKFKDLGLRMTLRDINSLRLMLACIYQEWEVAEKLISALEPFLYTDKWNVRRHAYLVYMGFASIILGNKTNRKKGKKFRQLGNKITKIFETILKNGSKDALSIIVMLKAIKSPSKERFDEAIRTTARLGMVHHTAIIYENAGLFFMERDKKSWAEYYLAKATTLYGEWGAEGKTTQMLDKYDFLHPSSLNQNFGGGNIHGRTRFTEEPLFQTTDVISSIVTNNGGFYDEKEH